MSRLLLCFALLLPALAGAQTLRIHGSNTIGARLAPDLAEAWLRSRACERIDRATPAENELTLGARCGEASMTIELRAHGSSTGFADLAAGSTDIAMSSRPVNAKELAQSASLGKLDSAAQEAVIALDGVAVIVHPANPLQRLSLAQAREVFSGAITDWASLGGAPGRIALHARDENSGTWETFRTLVLGEAPLRGDAMRYESTQSLANAVAGDPRAIGFVGVSGVGGARALAIAETSHALSPEIFTVAVEDYPLSRRLFFYTAQSASDEARAFVEFTLSPAGQAVVQASGFVAQDVRSYPAVARDDAPAEYQALVRDASRLSVNFRFGAGSRLLDGKVLRDVERLADFMRQPGNQDRPLLLLGFADASETSPYLAVSLSNDRVDLVANLLEDRGVPAQRARGMGGAAPVASNATEQGRLRNRRVEVWLGPR